MDPHFWVQLFGYRFLESKKFGVGDPLTSSRLFNDMIKYTVYFNTNQDQGCRNKETLKHF